MPSRVVWGMGSWSSREWALWKRVELLWESDSSLESGGMSEAVVASVVRFLWKERGIVLVGWGGFKEA